ncbi:hypothetical protein FEM48_Zijuj12G0191600 [Ziziphus jujuba var. spinosa]|uniref:Heat shock factor-binding protein 1-like n=1 Tax=Ziziphus jujuba var. spinosa TaxID=714518 RepID=A0A978UF15_ZIZJJ|nr:hypothetical protein FEM48_Zijuj12G0191600 [Ziziphus jujuba var. spinosa]
MDGHDTEDTKQSTADMTAFVSTKSSSTDDCGHARTLLMRNENESFVSLVSLRKEILVLYFSSKMAWFSISSALFFLLDQNVLDEMGSRIDELEQSINDLRTEMGVEGSPPPPAPKVADDSA